MSFLLTFLRAMKVFVFLCGNLSLTGWLVQLDGCSPTRSLPEILLNKENNMWRMIVYWDSFEDAWNKLFPEKPSLSVSLLKFSAKCVSIRSCPRWLSHPIENRKTEHFANIQNINHLTRLNPGDLRCFCSLFPFRDRAQNEHVPAVASSHKKLTTETGWRQMKQCSLNISEVSWNLISYFSASGADFQCAALL